MEITIGGNALQISHCFMQTWHLLTLCRRLFALIVSCTGFLNWFPSSIVASQKLRVGPKYAHVPRPWHSMYGWARKSFRQDPGDASNWPSPWAPALLYCKQEWTDVNLQEDYIHEYSARNEQGWVPRSDIHHNLSLWQNDTAIGKNIKFCGAQGNVNK